MPQSLSNVIIHIIFSTKNRHPFLISKIRDPLHRYLATVVRDKDCECFAVGGVDDHIHLAVRLGRTIHQSELLNILKSTSSKWLKATFPELQHFTWQHGYGSFSIAPSQLNQLIRYIENQEEHHKKISFQDEYRSILDKYEISYDEKYVWD